MTGPRPLYFAMLLGSGLAWGSTQVLGKWAVSTGYQFMGLIFWQMMIGASLLGAVLLVRRRPFAITMPRLRFAAIIAVIGTLIPNSTFYIAVAELPAGIMSILISTVPLLAFPIALALGKDRFSLPRLAGLVCGLIGVALIALPQGSLPEAVKVAFIPLALVGPLFYAMESNFVAANGMAGMDAVQAMALSLGMGALIALPLALGLGQWINPLVRFGVPEWSLVASSIVHVLAYTAYVWLASKAGAVFAAQSAYIVTGSGVIWAMVLLDETFSSWVWAALVLMMLGLSLVQPRDPAPVTE
jgi:drug/metabolite transporter (DMT)-like permease